MVKIDLGERKHTLRTEGLTLVEVMVAMLISAICLGTALQAYIGAVSIQAKSQQINAAIAKMEADAESIRQKAKETTACEGNYVQALMNKVLAPRTDPTPPETTESTQETKLFSRELPEDYQLTRTMEISASAQNVLKVSYALTRPESAETGEPTTLAQLSLTVMPSAALLCP
jgi:prepilin-type N-terminal cleavage/methylation domain-containing protein